MLELFNIIFDGKFVTLDCKSYDTPKIGGFKVVFKLKEEELVWCLDERLYNPFDAFCIREMSYQAMSKILSCYEKHHQIPSHAWYIWG